MNVQKLVGANTPQRLWCISEPITPKAWEAAIEIAQRAAPWPFAAPLPMDELLEATLGEGQFGPRRYTLGRTKAIYYSFVRPILPSSLRPLIRRVSRHGARTDFPLGWPIEDRYVRFQYDVLSALLDLHQEDSLTMRWFWPDDGEFALCLTHDVEGEAGHDFVPALMDLEEQLGFRSAFNFVPGEYTVDPGLLQEVKRRGFEIGVHGYRHDGKLFRSHDAFAATAPRINEILHRWGATGFRSPLTHRHPVWMQALDIEYDLSYFDTDPFEPMAGGTMSIWPFLLGRFVELPYTLPQDHTIFEMGERSPRIWQEKVRFIRAHHGLALVNVHPDYMREPGNLAVYAEFLSWLNEERTFWHAIPRDIARRWRLRSFGEAAATNSEWRRVTRHNGGIALKPIHRADAIVDAQQSHP